MKSVPDNRLSEISAELRKATGNTLLDRGRCPVCGTELVKIPDDSKSLPGRKE